MREYFPFFKNNPNIIYLDSAATSQTLYTVIEDQTEFLTNRKSNAHRSGHSMGTWVDEKYNQAKELIGQWLGIKNPLEHVVFNSGASQGLSDAISLISQRCSAGTIFVYTDSHHSLLLPIQQLVETNPQWQVVYLDVSAEGTIDTVGLEQQIKKCTGIKVIAFSAVSNVLGKINNLGEIARLADKHNLITVMDASQIVGKRKLDASNFDFVTWSWHKVYGPTGLGCLVFKPQWLAGYPIRPGGGTVTSVKLNARSWVDTAQKFEAGTQNLQAIVAIPNLVKWLMEHQQAIAQHDSLLAAESIKLATQFNFKIAAKPDSGLISVLPGSMAAEDYAMMLDAKSIMVRAGKMCAQPLVDDLTSNKSLLRFSWAAYSSLDELNTALETFYKIHEKFQRTV